MMIEVPEHCKHFAAALREAVDVIARAVRPRQRGVDVLQLEGVIAQALARVESAAMGDLLSGLDTAADAVEFAGKTWGSLGSSPTTYFTRSGPTTIERRLFRERGVHKRADARRGRGASWLAR
jgi:hypothetical protein